jgi:hypothetical protein
MRYHEERGKGKSQVEAITTAVMKIGRAIIASGVTTIGGFAALLFATGILAVRDFSIMTVLNVFLALVGTLLVLPPLLVSVDLWWEKRSLTTIRHSLDGVFSELDRAASKDTEDVSPQASD